MGRLGWFSCGGATLNSRLRIVFIAIAALQPCNEILTPLWDFISVAS
jgi:hypothetical protein